MRRQKNHSKDGIKTVEIFKIDSVGVNLERFRPVRSVEEKNVLRKELGFSESDFILIYTAEFIHRKNHRLIFDILPELKKKIPELKVVLCGKGELLESYMKYAAEHGMDYITFTGYTKRVSSYCQISDVCISASLQEGQGLNLVESMACGLPVVASGIRGHKDVISNGWNGILCDLQSPGSFADALILLYRNPALREEMGRRNVEEARKYSVDIAVERMAKIYVDAASSSAVSRGGGSKA